MRIAALALVSALISVLAACNPSAPSGGGGVFPDMNGASYRAEATIHGDNGQTLPVVMIRSGNKVRMEMNGPTGQMAVVNNADTSENFVLMTNGGETYAIQADPSQYEDPTANWNAEYAQTATRTGDCSVVGENGAEWTRTVDNVAHVACVTQDGIILRASEGDRVVWETTSVQRGPQDAALFTMPEGVQTMDLGAMMGQAQGAGVNAQICNALRNAGAPPERIAQAGC